MSPHTKVLAANAALVLVGFLGTPVAEAQTAPAASEAWKSPGFYDSVYSQYYQNAVPAIRGMAPGVSGAASGTLSLGAAPTSTAPSMVTRSTTGAPSNSSYSAGTAYSGGMIGGTGQIGKTGSAGVRHVSQSPPPVLNQPQNSAPNATPPRTRPGLLDNTYSQYYQSGVPQPPVNSPPIYGGKAYTTGALSPARNSSPGTVYSGGGIGGTGQIGGTGGTGQSGVRSVGARALAGGQTMGAGAPSRGQTSSGGGVFSSGGPVLGRGLATPPATFTPLPFGSVAAQQRLR